MRILLQVLIILGVACNLFLGCRIAWPTVAPYAAAIAAPGICPFWARAGSVHNIQEMIVQSQYFDQADRIERSEAGLDLWATPRGPVWMPKGDTMLPFILAEQSLNIYGGRNRGVRPGDIVLDCGANVGMFTKTALQAGASLVVAIEPAPPNVECLRRNLAAETQQHRVVLYSKGIWDHDDDSPTLSIDEHNPGADSMVLQVTGKASVRVPVTTIDRLATELKLRLTPNNKEILCARHPSAPSCSYASPACSRPSLKRGASAGIYGSILDPQGAIIAGARVTLQHVPTNQTRKPLSNTTFARITSTDGGPRILQFSL